MQLKGIRERGGEAGPGVKDPAGIQFVNLSPAWRDPDVYSYFNNSGECSTDAGGCGWCLEFSARST